MIPHCGYRYMWNREIVFNSQKLVKRRKAVYAEGLLWFWFRFVSFLCGFEGGTSHPTFPNKNWTLISWYYKCDNKKNSVHNQFTSSLDFSSAIYIYWFSAAIMNDFSLANFSKYQRTSVEYRNIFLCGDLGLITGCLTLEWLVNKYEFLIRGFLERGSSFYAQVVFHWYIV